MVAPLRSCTVSISVSLLVRLARLPKTMKHRPRLKLVLLSLADHAHDDGSNAWPSVATIAAECESSPRTIEGVDGALAALETAGFIEKQEQAKQRRPAVWRLNLGRLAATADPQLIAALVKNPSFKEATFQATRIPVAPHDPAGLGASLDVASKPDKGRTLCCPDPQLPPLAPQVLQPGPHHIADDPVLDPVLESVREPVSPSPEKRKTERPKALSEDGAEIRIRAERRVGELIAAQRQTVGLNHGSATEGIGRRGKRGSESDPHSEPVTLAEAGIDKHLADRARKLAAVPVDEDVHIQAKADLQRVKRKLLGGHTEPNPTTSAASLEELVDLARQNVEAGYPPDRLRMGVLMSMQARSLHADLMLVDEAVVIATTSLPSIEAGGGG
jgi:hypothetical protein